MFDQILEMDEEDDKEFSRALVQDFFDQSKETFKGMDEALSVYKILDLYRRANQNPSQYHPVSQSCLQREKGSDDSAFSGALSERLFSCTWSRSDEDFV